MKKLFLVGALALFAAVNAQFKVGAHVGLPVGDLGKATSFNLGADVSYLYPVAENFKVGATTGYTYYFGKEQTITVFGQTITAKNDGAGMIPLAAVAQYNLTPDFYLGTDLGVIFSTEKDGGSAFYYQPKVGYNVNENIDLSIGYKGWSPKGGGNAGTIALGFGYTFNK